MHPLRAVGSALLLSAMLAQPVFAGNTPVLTKNNLAVPADSSEEETPGASIRAAFITLGSTYLALPVAIGLGAATNPGIGTVTGLFGLPVAVGAGHIYAGDPGRGIGLGLGTYPVIAGSGILSYFIIPWPPDSPGPLSGLGPVIASAMFGLVSGVVYTLFVAGDAANTIRQNQPGQTKNHNGSNQWNGYPWTGDD